MTAYALTVVDEKELAETAARSFGDAIRETVVRRGRCSLALSRPPERAFALLASSAVDWSAVDIFQVDERVAPDEHADRNLTVIERDFGDVLHRATLHPMPVTAADLEDAARRYSQELESVCGSPPVLDVVHVGLGPDGHTASLLPGDPVLDVRDRWVAVTGESAGYRRLTLTYPVLDAARVVIFVVGGKQKAEALHKVLDGDVTMPAARLAARDVRVVADADAAPPIPNPGARQRA